MKRIITATLAAATLTLGGCVAIPVAANAAPIDASTGRGYTLPLGDDTQHGDPWRSRVGSTPTRGY